MKPFFFSFLFSNLNYDVKLPDWLVTGCHGFINPCEIFSSTITPNMNQMRLTIFELHLFKNSANIKGFVQLPWQQEPNNVPILNLCDVGYHMVYNTL